GDGQYCNTDDGRCANGCRVDDPESCPADQVCDPEKHTCEDVRCGDDGDCPEAYYCDPDTSLCTEGCRGDEDCQDGEQCIDHECVERCIPGSGECGDGRYCDADTEQCRDECNGDEDCDGEEFCAPDSNECVDGCRDDDEDRVDPPDSPDNPVLIPLGPPNADGVRSGSALGRVVCGDDSDFFAVEALPGERIRIDLIYNRDAGNLDLRLDGDPLEEPLVAATLEVPERLEYPPLGELVQDAATYLIEVFPPGNDPSRRIEYEIRVSAVDANASCFADERENGAGDDSRENATAVPDRGGRFLGNICPGDVDWFVMRLDPNDGLQLDLRLAAGSDPVTGYLFPANRNQANPVARLDQASGYRFQGGAGQGLFAPAGDWFVVIEGADRNAQADYDLNIVHDAGERCGTDSDTEPNDTLADAVNLGNVPPGAEFDVQLDLSICTVDEPDVDIFCFGVEAGETIEGWVVTEPLAVDGRLAVRFSNAAGALVGREGLNTEPGEAIDPARVVGTVEGNYCVRVEGRNDAQGPYSLHLRRTQPMGGVCELDRAEAAVRNDTAGAATPLADVSGDLRRQEYDEGYICDPMNGQDEDWYSFRVPQPGSSLCVVLEGFEADRADVDLEIYPSMAGAGDRCQTSAECGDAGACVGGRCTAPDEVSLTGYDTEMINLRRPFVGQRSGDFLLRVTHDDDHEGPYAVRVTVTPPEMMCPPDWQEQGNPNDAEEDATFLGSGQVAACDTWICRNERGAGDWFEIEVPANEDRTVVINYSNPIEGRLRMDLFGPDAPGDEGSGYVFSQAGAGNFQCINIRGGGASAAVRFNVGVDEFADAQRIDYSLRVLPTDLDARPDGECTNVGAPDLGACPPRAEWPNDPLFGRFQPDACWATVDIPR
ncbi:MAG: hypothetical protein KC620_19020, partial [Myxococcales bacterium]|nr:hypothetical protein [Myxococcales bacterium]